MKAVLLRKSFSIFYCLLVGRVSVSQELEQVQACPPKMYGILKSAGILDAAAQHLLITFIWISRMKPSYTGNVLVETSSYDGLFWLMFLLRSRP